QQRLEATLVGIAWPVEYGHERVDRGLPGIRGVQHRGERTKPIQQRRVIGTITQRTELLRLERSAPQRGLGSDAGERSIADVLKERGSERAAVAVRCLRATGSCRQSVCICVTSRSGEGLHWTGVLLSAGVSARSAMTQRYRSARHGRVQAGPCAAAGPHPRNGARRGCERRAGLAQNLTSAPSISVSARLAS